MTEISPPTFNRIEPLARAEDVGEYRAGLERYRAGAWDETRWTAFRLRHGVYGQRQPGRQMLRIKLPGGVLPVAALPALAALTRDLAQEIAHLTTRQDLQLYHIPLDRTPEALERLASAGLTSREAGGNTVRNVNACALAGACPRQRVDAGAVARRLAGLWLRRPLVQAMPRKIKLAVSGCTEDCGAARVHDLGLIATERDGENGFRVVAGGGLGSQPAAAIELIDFAREADLPAVLEALLRVHVAQSDRTDRARARLKSTIRRIGADAFRAAFATELASLRGLAQRPWPPLDWHHPAPAEGPLAPDGLIAANDGSTAAIVPVPFGRLSADQLDGLHAVALARGVSEIRLTRGQDLVLLGLGADSLDGLDDALAAIGLKGPASVGREASLISCPGTSTCRIGITNAPGLAARLAAGLDDGAPARLSVSGCHNSCGLHHLADIGLHGLTRLIDGKPAPYYRLHFGGEVASARFALDGPLVPARQADRAVTLLRRALAEGRRPGESVRAWAERLGPDGIAALLAPLGAEAPQPDWLYDWDAEAPFAGPPRAGGECAAPQAPVAHLADLARDGLERFDRFLAAGRWPEALKAGEESSALALRALLAGHGLAGDDGEAAEAVFARFHASPADRGAARDAFDSIQAERTSALVTGQAGPYRDALAWLIELLRPEQEGGR
ncbi:MAG: hypothetical protein RLZZ501_969 [Pseudomonadota bacterium]|jgi:sulfite reductase (NADPH) hemoprotein beta-component